MGGDGGEPQDAATSPPDGDVVLPDGAIVPSPCVSPSGYAVCGGPMSCFPPSQQSMESACWSCELSPTYGLTPCVNTANPDGSSDVFASDGEVYIEDTVANLWRAYPFEVGQLFAVNGASDRVRYADFYPWTGDALPTPTTCPTFTGFSICGGDCGPCASDELCTGRSPMHPYGLCMPTPTTTNGCGSAQNWACASGTECVVFQSSGDGQQIADAYGLCMATAACEAIASSYPGGAICHGQ